MERNRLFFGDCLDVLRDEIATNSVDLIYLDPPFNSNRSYNVFFENKGEEEARAQIQAFDDTWSWTAETAQVYEELQQGRNTHVAEAVEAMYRLLGPNDVMAYLVMMTPRLVELRRVLKPTGTLYLHADPTASHYLKVMLDSIFGAYNFRSEIIWTYKYGGRGKRDFGKKHDVLLRYVNGRTWKFNYDAVKTPHEPDSLEQNYRFVDEDGRRYRKGTWKSGKEYRYYADEGRGRDDVWTDIGSLHQADKERLGYPTQKPERLLELIIEAGSDEGDAYWTHSVGAEPPSLSPTGSTESGLASTLRSWPLILSRRGCGVSTAGK